MKTVRPKPMGTPLGNLPLSPEEGFVLSRIDGTLSVRDLVALTGIEQQRVEEIVDKLASHGAVLLDADSTRELAAIDASGASGEGAESGETASLADFASVLGMDPSAFAGAPESRREAKSDYPPPAVASPSAPEVEDDVPVLEPLDESTPAELEEVVEDAGSSEPAEASEAPEDEPAVDERNFRQLYESRYHPLPTDQRVQIAHTAAGSDLLCLCLDADPRVIAAILENPKAGLDHARLIAFHHRTGVGLELVSRRQEFARDVGVERRLLRNPQCGDVVLNRIMSTKQLQQTYKICMDREVPDMTRNKTRGHLRKKWQTAASEERADLLMRTEGRCLIFMTGCTLDARATSIICGKPLNSVLFIQNLAKFAATPPALLAHCMKQPFVRKNITLKRLLLQHPNMPGEAKRQA